MFKEYRKELILAAITFIVCVLLCGCIAKVVGDAIIEEESNTCACAACAVD